MLKSRVTREKFKTKRGEMTGKYIVIEGSDGTGKSTQAKKLQAWLEANGHSTVLVEEPGGTAMADAIRSLLKDKTINRHPKTNIGLFTSARIDLWGTVIQPALANGKIVISSRNYYSTMVYQGYGEGVSLDYIIQISQLSLAERYCQPDIAVILTSSQITNERAKRLSKRVDQTTPEKDHDFFESKPADFQERIDQGYLALANRLNIPVVEAIGTVDEVFANLLQAIESKLQKHLS